MRFDKILTWLVSALLSCNIVFSLNILAVLPYQGKSHFFVFETYLQELARRGHNLTVISHFPQQRLTENYHDISLAGKMQAFEGTLPVPRSYWSILKLLFFLYDIGRQNCEVMLEHEKVQNLWQSAANFDLVVTEEFISECALGLAYKLGAPVVGVTSHVPMPWHYKILGIPYNLSYMPLMFIEGGTKPTLYQRIERMIFHFLTNLFYKHMCLKTNENQLRKYFDVPPLEDLARDIKFVLLYTNFVANGPAVLPANIIEVGGYHVSKPKKLPETLKTFIEESKHGVIYISFGSMLRATSLPKDKIKIIVDFISELPQRIIMKWDEKSLPENPKDVYLSSWLPQNDILGHPKVLAFLSHCGMLSITEAIYHGVPIICMPILGDQPTNAAALEESGLAVQIRLRELTKETLLQRMETVLDTGFRKKVKHMSQIWHDRPMSPMDTAIHWTEFAARSKNFTFRSPVSAVPLYQYVYFDICIVIIIILFVIIFVIKTILSLIKTTVQQKPRKVKTK